MKRSLQQLHEEICWLRSEIPPVVGFGIPWLQIKHPIHSIQRRLLLEEKGPSLNGLVLGMRALCVLGYAAYITLRCLQTRLVWRKALRLARARSFTLVAKSWVVPQIKPEEKDFYLGDLQQRMQKAGEPLLLLLGDSNGASWRMSSAPGRVGSVLCELCLVPWTAPFRVACEQIRTSARLWVRARSQKGDPWMVRVIRQACRDSLSIQILPRGLYYWIGRWTAEIWKPKAFITLYEGNGWEQLLWKGAKTSLPTCRSVGYQHTILLPHNLELLRRGAGSDASDPDLVLCLGEGTRDTLAASHPQSVLVPFGSFRRSAAETDAQPDPARKTLLVVPEGYRWEAEMLFNAALAVARLLPDHRVLLRCHPVLPMEEVLSLLSEDPGRVPNVEVSTGRPIEEDYARSSALLYRGSSSVLYAVLRGLKPIYLDHGGSDRVDPLFQLDSRWKETAGNPQELASILGRYAETAGRGAGEEWKSALAYVQSYAGPVSEKSEKNLLEALRQNRGTGRS